MENTEIRYRASEPIFLKLKTASILHDSRQHTFEGLLLCVTIDNYQQLTITTLHN